MRRRSAAPPLAAGNTSPLNIWSRTAGRRRYDVADPMPPEKSAQEVPLATAGPVPLSRCLWHADCLAPVVELVHNETNGRLGSAKGKGRTQQVKTWRC